MDGRADGFSTIVGADDGTGGDAVDGVAGSCFFGSANRTNRFDFLSNRYFIWTFLFLLYSSPRILKTFLFNMVIYFFDV